MPFSVPSPEVRRERTRPAGRPPAPHRGTWFAPQASATSPVSAQEFERLVTPHLPHMLRAAQNILGTEDLAWDAVQETLVRLWTRGWLPDEPVASLVHLTVKSSLHQLRCQRRRTDHELRGGDERPCCDEDPQLALESAEEARLVREVMGELTQDLRAVLELYEFEGQSYESIARRLELPIGTVRSRLSRGRTQLKARLASRFDAA